MIFCLVMSMLLGSTGLYVNNRLGLVSENVEALTKDYELKKIGDDMCYATEMGVMTSYSDLTKMPPNAVLY